jgi:hypothetical protein
MLKFLIIVFLVGYVLYKIFSFMGQVTNASREDSNLNVDKAPRKKKDYRGGEYVDYEEMK